MKTHNNTSHQHQVEYYYRFHAPIYDATRWSFLFGRSSIINSLPDLSANPRILEIGCGTGRNILRLKNRFPDANITGIDLSEKMLSVARSKTRNNHNIFLKQHSYASEALQLAHFDAILLSYSLTMIGEDYKRIFQHLQSDLKTDGYIAIVDFYTTPFSLFRRWMRMNHVDFSGLSFSLLDRHFKPIKKETHPAYFGLWDYYEFVGQKA